MFLWMSLAFEAKSVKSLGSTHFELKAHLKRAFTNTALPPYTIKYNPFTLTSLNYYPWDGCKMLHK